MPFYDFQCTKCETVVEVKAGISEKESGLDIACPACESTDLRQVFKAMAFNAGKLPARPEGPCGSACACYN